LRAWRQRRWQAGYQALQQLPPRLVTTTLFNRLERTLEAVSSQHIPADLWPLLAERAWHDLSFQHEMATWLQTHLRQTVIFTERDKILALLSPNTFWVLLALTPIPTALSRTWFTRAYWQTRWAAQRLQRMAAQQVLAAEQWANFWDQWVLLAAKTACPDAVEQCNPALYKALISLPIFQFTAAPAPQQAQDAPTAMLDETQAASKGQVSAPIPTWSTPAWQTAMPYWFYLQSVYRTPQRGR
jgi:hypothetical protein